MPDRTTSTSTGSCTQATVGDVVPTVAAIPSGHEGCADRQRLPPAGRAGLRRPDRRRRRARPARAVVGRRSRSAQVAERARAQAAGLDALGIAAGRAGRRSSATTRPGCFTSFFGVSGSGRILVPINFRLVAEEVAYIVEHSGARVLLVDPELDDALAGVEAEHRFVIGAESDDALLPVRRRARAVGAGRGRHGDASTTPAAPRPGRRACS